MLSIFGNAQIMMTFVLATVVAVIFSQGINQMLLQPAMAAKDERTIMRALWIAAPVNGLFRLFAVVLCLTSRSIPEFQAAGQKVAATSMLVAYLPNWLAALLLAAFLAAVARRRMTRQVFENSLRNTLRISCMFMWIILAALAFGAVFDGLGAVRAIENLFTERMGLSPWTILILMQLSFILMGTFLDDTAMLVIVAPLYVPLVDALGFNLIWYGVLYTITTQIAYMTPPFGYNLFLMRAMAPPEVTLGDIYRSIIPFVGVMIVALSLVISFPEIALWLPGHVYAN
jgi:TRAP-type C4-dicarboxylate transport system permease large subunit